MGRVLGRVRLSISRDESTSIERQKEAIEQWAGAQGHEIVGWAADSDISGSVDPFDTPGLGPWLGERAPEWEIVACWKLDRLSRSSIKLSKLIGWCLEHDKTLVSTSEAVDLGTPVGRLIANVIGFLAEGELEAIRERTISSRRKLRETARWAGGRPPYGYRVSDGPSGGKVLEIDPEAHAVVRRIVDAVIDGVPLVRIARDLDSDGIPPPADHYRVSVGKPPTGGTWKAGSIRNMLCAPTLVGYAHLGGVTVRDDEGQPVRMGEPLVTDDVRDLVIAELERVKQGPRARRESGQLAGILECWFCGSSMSQTRHLKKGRLPYRYYRCHVNACGPMIPGADAETLAEETFLHHYGDREVTERVWVRGDSNEADLKAAVAAFDELTTTAGVLTSKTAKDRLQRQLAALDARIAELEATPAREGRWEQRATGEKYSDKWAQYADDPEARRELLKRAGITIRIGISGVGRRVRNDNGVWHVDIYHAHD